MTLEGQEKDAATSGLARMSMILHGYATAVARLRELAARAGRKAHVDARAELAAVTAEAFGVVKALEGAPAPSPAARRGVS